MSVSQRMAPPGRKPSSRPQAARPIPLRAQTATPILNGRASPAESIFSNVANNRARSPSTTPRGGVKRKERDFDHDMALYETNINVVVRCRGRSDREVKENSGVVVSTDGVKGNAVELSMGPNSLSNKTYGFDRVFSPAADQGMVFEEVVKPILDQVVSGFNCTIFAYGQTGTGKTYTMSGDISDMLPLPDEAGIIPRVLYALFQKLEDEAESSVKCSFIELYNEELRDLLAADDAVKLKIFDDASRKTHAATLVQGMEETHIESASKGLELLKIGSLKRQVAATKCNDLSSRSHTIFTITTYMKRTTENGEDVVTSGKLNLVDLAGSENIQRSGAENKRATEAGLINKSLLTLGRVINALVDKNAHIPYRESKLTRLLQDSLGGRTKTCIIATLSPARSNLEETISTLDYAFRAKNIRNKPQTNHLFSKKTLIREFAMEIEKLKSELIATRQRNGVYLTTGTYEEMTVESESRRILTEEQRDKIETMEVNLRNKAQELFSLTSNLNFMKKDYESTKNALEETQNVLEKTEIVLNHARESLAEEEMLRKAHAASEDKLTNIGQEMIATLGRTTTEIDGLHAKHKRRSDLQAVNRSNWNSSQNKVSMVTSLVEQSLVQVQQRHDTFVAKLTQRLQGFVQNELFKLGESTSFLDEKQSVFQNSEVEVQDQTAKARDQMNTVLEGMKNLRGDLKQQVGDGLDGFSAAAKRISEGVIIELESFNTQLHQSYSTLGKEFKVIFDDLLRDLTTHQSEAEDLRGQISRAGEALVSANENHSKNLEKIVSREREQAAEDRASLLSEITTLINNRGEKQDRRLEETISNAQLEIVKINQNYERESSTYNDGMERWATKAQELQSSLQQAREQVKQKVKGDWATVNQRTTSISETTRSVYQETIRIVDAQMVSIDEQLSALDEILSSIRAQNSSHHDAHVQSLARLGTTVRQSYLSIGEHMSESAERTRSFSEDLSNQISNVRSTVEPLTDELQVPLAGLRSEILASNITEYAPTGITPERTTYFYPKVLPRTRNHEKLIASFRGESVPESPRKSSQKRPRLDILELTSSDDIPLQQPLSPSKAQVFTDSPTADDSAEDVTQAEASSPILLRNDMEGSNSNNDNGQTDRGLREVDINVATADVNTAVRSGRKGHHKDRPPTCKKQDANEKAFSQPGGLGAKSAKTPLTTLAEGRENLPLAASVGGGRVLRARRS